MTVETKQPTQQETPSAVPKVVRERTNFYRVRNRVYTVLLVFVAAAGLPVVGVPVLRHRLAERAQILKMAVLGTYSKAVLAKAGANREPFPAQYEHSVPKRNYPQLPAYLSAAMNQTPDVGQVYPPRALKEPRVKSAPKAEQVPPSLEQQKAQAQPAEQAPPADVPAQDAEPVYRQGKLEQEVYDILLQNDANVAGLVQNKNASYHFKSWDVAKREEDLYWVRIVFTQVASKSDMECIWQVQLMSKQVMPLNYNARSLPRL